MENFKKLTITKQNIFAIPKDWLIIRYEILQKNIKVSKNKSLVNDAKKEVAIINEYFEGYHDLRNKNLSAEEQIEMEMPLPLKSQYVPIVEDRLEEHHLRTLMKESLQKEIEHAEKTRANMPKITASYSVSNGSTEVEYQSSTERAVMKQYDRVDRLSQELYQLEESMYIMTHVVLPILNADQTELINCLYLSKNKPSSNNIAMEQLCWHRAKYYRIKKSALIKIAAALKLI